MKLNLKKLELLMAEKCIETRELAKRIGVSESTISKIKNGKQNAKPVTIGKLAKGLNCDVTKLLED